MPRRFFCLIAGVVGVLLDQGAPVAFAGAWTLPEGQGQFILTTGRKTQPFSAQFGSGGAGSVTRDVTSAQAFAEFGLLDKLTLGLVGRVEYNALNAALDLRVGGHARYRLWQGVDGDVASVQLGASGPVNGAVSGIGLPRNLTSVPEVQLGGLYGRGWSTPWGNAFVTSELAYRWRGRQEADEIRLEATGGLKPSHHFMGILSIFASQPVESGGTATLKLAPSLAYTFWPWLGPNDKKPDLTRTPSTLQLGVVYDTLNPEDGITLNVSVWNSF